MLKFSLAVSFGYLSSISGRSCVLTAAAVFYLQIGRIERVAFRLIVAKTWLKAIDERLRFRPTFSIS